ncbi:MAG: hypothetical protein IPO82_18765 [Betaproteobacteria bacterium]|nr:hypothetical protein [Betaproteobacteria bacterium]
MSLILHAALLATLGSVLTSAWRGADFTAFSGSGTPLQAVLAPPAPAAESEPPPAPPVEVATPAPASPPVAPVAPAPAAPTPVPPAPAAPPAVAPAAAPPPGLTQPGTGQVDAPRRPAPLPTDSGDVAVGPAADLSGFGPVTTTRLALQFPVRPGRLPRLARTLTVVYPEAALRERASTQVAALLLLDAKGTVVETVIEPDDTVFAPAVREALASAVFLPAQAADAPLPYWIALEFVFAVDPVKPNPATAN